MSARWEVFRDKGKQSRFRLLAANGEVIAQSEGYVNQQDALKAIRLIQSVAKEARVELVDSAGRYDL